jgi:VWFA-related protein
MCHLPVCAARRVSRLSLPYLAGIVLLSGGFCAPLRGQKPPDQADAPQKSVTAREGYTAKSSVAEEVVTRDSPTTFKVRVNLVLVRVVVRDEHGKVIEDLKKDDFLLFDNRKPQAITTFSVETPKSRAVPAVAAVDHPDGEAIDKSSSPGDLLPQRFVTLLFDDMHLEMNDAVTVRVAAGKIFDSLASTDRVAVYTTSGQVSQDFTSDRELLKSAINQVTARPLTPGGTQECPNISYYQADLIVNQNDQQALSIAVSDALQCAFGGDQRQAAAAATMARSAASRALTLGDNSSEYTYRHMEDALRRLSVMPGQRKLVFISPGFILSQLFAERVDIIDRSNRAGVVIDTVDARGLYTPDALGDIANPPTQSSGTGAYQASYRLTAQSAQSGILDDLALGTGGTHFRNRNDLEVVLREAMAAPPTSYLLGFSPQNLKLNGSFHTLKVSLAGKQKYAVQARRGFYAPRTAKNPEETAKQEIREAVFSQEEIRDLAVDLQTQFFRKDTAEAHLSVLAHVDLKSLKFRKADGRNRDDLTLATVIFDENGNFVTGGEKILEMKLRDATLERLDRSGITVKSSFDVKPGNYLVRLVVREKEGEMMAARNGAVVIPY